MKDEEELLEVVPLAASGDYNSAIDNFYENNVISLNLLHYG